MANICKVCGREFASPAALGSHMRKHKPKEVKGSSGEPTVTVKLVVEQASHDPQPKPYTCPECGRELEPMLDSPGIYKLQCKSCWEGG